ncbi:uncharacterized protein LOC112517774 [Cynara cardunculus var. scolymus]|uniref:uncharacterized protein LOC112517774 n=1 Tax=Cynara cardunculus var. scolymus TaxID=59895 RepID=UPI000D626513|nr:uncharacterized protein LOC112517774 [Cynara cardunculus var. scolymus]
MLIKLNPLWLSCLSASFRTALACAIVAAATLFGPSALRRQVAFPAFSYVTVILIVTGASLGDAFRGCWDAVCATFLTVIPAILGLWAIGPSRLTTALTSTVVAVAAFVVMLPDHRTHLVSKRIALGQIVIIYVVAYDMGGETDPVMHPVHVAASTAIGVLACVLALLLPYPSLATCQVKKKCKLYVDNASERLKLCVKAFCAQDNISAQAFASQANSLSINGTKLLNAINSKKESMKWETLPIEFLKPYCMNTAEKLQAVEIPVKGLQIALHHLHSFPPQILDHDLKDSLHKLQENITLTFDQLKSCMPSDHLATFPESNLENLMLPLHSFPQTHKDLPSFFFLFCSKLLQKKMTESSSANPLSSRDERNKKNPEWNLSEWISTFVRHRRFMLALKCSLSVGFAVLFGLIYSKQNGIWSGLPVAISFAASREAAFRVSNLKAQGTVLGTVYGVLGCFVLEKFVKVRFLILLPWFIFCSLIRRSRMYGPAGGVSAVIGAVLVLGRENFGSPTEFAIIRIVEAFIGLSCSIVVELVFQPTRASTLAKIQLSKTLQVLHECVCAVSLGSGSKDCIGNGRNKLKANVNELRKFIQEAEMEPNFWFLPFNGVCYNKLLKTLSNMEALLVFMNHANESLEQESRQMGRTMSFKILEGDVELFKEMIHPSIKCFERVILVKSLNKLDKDLQKSGPSSDIELGKLPYSPQKLNVHSEDEMGKMVNSYLERSKEFVVGEGCEEVKGHELVLSLSAFAFCLRGLVRDTKEIEKGVMELLQWENPSSHVNLYEISCKIHAICDI